MAIQTRITPGGLFRQSHLQQVIVSWQIRAADGRMPQMIAERPPSHSQAPRAGIHQPNRELGILTAPADELFVIAIHSNEVLPPNGEITSANPAQITALAAEWARPAIGMLQTTKLSA